MRQNKDSQFSSSLEIKTTRFLSFCNLCYFESMSQSFVAFRENDNAVIWVLLDF